MILEDDTLPPTEFASLRTLLNGNLTHCLVYRLVSNNVPDCNELAVDKSGLVGAGQQYSQGGKLNVRPSLVASNRSQCKSDIQYELP